MCSNYRPPSPEVLRSFSRGLPTFGYDADAYPERVGPFLSNRELGTWWPGTFGLLPHWAEPALARRTYNARSESVATKPSFQHAWRVRQLAVVPVQAFFEPCYESGKAIRWRIERADQAPFGLAGIWETRPGPVGADWYSFSMLTINADGHPLMHRFHKAGDEKRSVVVLDDKDWDAWLTAKAEDAVRHFLRPFDADMFRAIADPRPPPAKRA